MNEQTLLSIIIPVYNIEDCLERCVDSVRNQTWKNLEILLVDDGSTDRSGQMCDQFAQEDGRIKVFHKKNGGSSSARNLGIANAGGEYLGFVDSDDWIDHQMYEELIAAAKKYNAPIVSASRDEIDEQGNKRPDVCVPPEVTTACPSADFLKELLMHRGDCSFCTKLIRRELFEGRGFPEGKLNEDFYLLVQMLADVKCVVTLPGQMYHVFYRIGSNTRKKDKNDFSRVFMDIVENADYAQQIVEKSYPQLKTEAVRFGLYQRLDYMLHIPVGRMVNTDTFYVNVKRWLRKHFADILKNPLLTKRDRIYLILLTTAPKTIRSVHGITMRLRGV